MDDEDSDFETESSSSSVNVEDYIMEKMSKDLQAVDLEEPFCWQAYNYAKINYFTWIKFVGQKYPCSWRLSKDWLFKSDQVLSSVAEPLNYKDVILEFFEENQVSFKIIGPSLSGMSIDSKSVGIFPTVKAPEECSTQFVSGDYVLWNTLGKCPIAATLKHRQPRELLETCCNLM